ncbi:uracil phosphoribosyltransferase [Gillisia limnaea]|uniref:Uracil phosphoribosyltransferase n=1 Tax=Gillisia limnaea (strain DSM 15749 / LMG 21470 / R-8282) TaxID=865937 RepID=H2BYM5_GILLR|nr:uracil phosphoribosyltransferase [Gillisia limnaea]EHQ01146.1 uracil phosphoribosyltransferase [Gillisia limnaea DSM 15749]
MQVFNLEEKNSILNKFIAEVRDVKMQSDKMRFRRNIERIGEILGYELSKTLIYKETSVISPLGVSKISLLDEELVICSILRAGLPLHNGLLNYFDNAENSFISAYRHHSSKTEFEIKVEYLASPSLEGKTLILADPMLATGLSFINVFNALKAMGTPKNIHLVSVIGSKQGIETLQKELPDHVKLWIATVDNDLDEHGYIVPGLGDAGDLCFGTKLQH